MMFSVKNHEPISKPKDARWFFLAKFDGKQLIRSPININNNNLKTWKDALTLAKKYFLIHEEEKALEIVLYYLNNTTEKIPANAFFYAAFFAFQLLEKNLKEDLRKEYYIKIFNENLEKHLKTDETYLGLALKSEYYLKGLDTDKQKNIFQYINSKFFLDPLSNMYLAKKAIEKESIKNAIEYLKKIQRGYTQIFPEVFVLMQDSITSTNDYLVYEPIEIIKDMENIIEIKKKHNGYIIEGISFSPLNSEDFSDIAIQMLRIGNFKDSEKYAAQAIELNKKEVEEKGELVNINAYLVKMLCNMAIIQRVYKYPINEQYFKENRELMNLVEINSMENPIFPVDARFYYLATINYVNWLTHGKEIKTKEDIMNKIEVAKTGLRFAKTIYPFFLELQILLESTINSFELEQKLENKEELLD